MKHGQGPRSYVGAGLLVWFSWLAVAHAEPGAPPAGEAAPAAPRGATESAPAPGPPSHRQVDPFPAASFAPVLFVSEGLEHVLDLPELRKRLSEALGRELVSLVDGKARRAQATIWVGVTNEFIVLRVTPPQRPEVWRQLPRRELGANPVVTLVQAVLEMFWADTFARLDAGEIQDPFCPPGLICLDPRRAGAWPSQPEAEVLDPWDTSYRRFYGWDAYMYSGRYPASAALTPPYPGRQVRATTPVRPQGEWSSPLRRSEHHYAVGLLAGGGVYKGGAFFRYEVNAMRRFQRFDFGLAFLGARGQPEPITKARRAITALLERRFLADDFELDLGASFGTFFATFDDRPVEVRPYLRGLVTFALPVGPVFDLLVQSELATTFISVPATGIVEYALTLGLRHRM